jgi:hypothetical protein
LATFEKWLREFLKNNSKQVFRVKGVLNVGRENRYCKIESVCSCLRFILQGVHDHFNITEHTAWGQDPKLNKIVFIGKSLQFQKITESATVANNVPFVIEPTGASYGGQDPPYGRLVVILLIAAYFMYPDQVSAIAVHPAFLLSVLIVIMLLFRKPSKPNKSD